MPELIVHLIVVMAVCGFFYWAYLKLMPHAPIADPFKSVIDVLVVLLIGGLILFYVIIPLLNQLPRLLHG